MRHPHVAKWLSRNRHRTRATASFKGDQRSSSADWSHLVEIVLDMLDDMGPCCRLRKCVGGVMRAQRGPRDQRDKQAQRADDRCGVYSPPSFCAAAPIHDANSVRNHPGLQHSPGCEITASLLKRHFCGHLGPERGQTLAGPGPGPHNTTTASGVTVTNNPLTHGRALLATAGCLESGAGGSGNVNRPLQRGRPGLPPRQRTHPAQTLRTGQITRQAA